MTTTDLGYDDPPNPADLDARYRGVLAELARIHDGADGTPVPAGERATTAQVWCWLINADPAERMEHLAFLLQQAEDGYNCWQLDHAAGIRYLERLAASRAAE